MNISPSKILDNTRDINVISELVAQFIFEEEYTANISIWLKESGSVFSLVAAFPKSEIQSNERQTWSKETNISDNGYFYYSGQELEVQRLARQGLINNKIKALVEIPLVLFPYTLGFIRIEFKSIPQNYAKSEFLESALTYSKICAKSIYKTIRCQEIHLHQQAEQIAKNRELREKDDALSMCVDSFVTADSSGKIIRVSPNTEKLFHYKDSELLGKSIKIISPTLYNLISNKSAHSKLEEYQEIGCNKKDGTGLIAIAAAIPARSAYGQEEIIGTTFLIRDISEMVRNRKKLTNLQEKIKLDPLTGIYNRQFAEQWFKAKMAELSELNQVMLIGMVDIDFFKKINDTYGHQFGDRALIRVSQLLNKAMREQDMIARYGGEEFIIALSNCTEIEGEAILERIRTKIANTKLKTDDDEIVNVTVSIGFDICSSQKYISETIRNADIALYKAKAMSRNRVVYAGDGQMDILFKPETE